MMISCESWKELACEYKLQVDDLHERLRVLGRNYDRLREELLAKPQPHVPTVVDEGEYECGKCGASLDGDWSCCPWCESPIDWDGIEDGNWYAEEGERFLQAEVYGPIREAMF